MFVLFRFKNIADSAEFCGFIDIIEVAVRCDQIFCVFVAMLCLIPLLHVIATSFSGKTAIISSKVIVWPVDFTLNNYRYIMKDMNFYSSFLVSVERVCLALVVDMMTVLLAAYPLSLPRAKFSARQFYVWYFMITMMFGGGMVPTYLIVSRTGLLNNILSLVLPNAANVFFIILMMNFMKALPEALSEAAELDGAGYFTILFRIILPLCKPSIATIVLFTAVNHWNEWFAGMLYINDNMKWPLQTYLQSVVVKTDVSQLTDVDTLAALVDMQGTNTAKIVLAMIPILCFYPFLQKYFVTGIVLGSVKE